MELRIIPINGLGTSSGEPSGSTNMLLLWGKAPSLLVEATSGPFWNGSKVNRLWWFVNSMMVGQ